VLRICVNVFWLAFLADGVLSVADEVVSPNTDWYLLGLARSLLAFLVLAASLFAAGLVALSPRVPKRVLVPLILFLWWAGPGMAFPLGFWKVPGLSLGLAAAQVFLGVAVWIFFRRATKFWEWPFGMREGPGFSWKHTLVASPALALAALVFAILSVAFGLSAEIESISGGYVRLRFDGIYLLERQFKSGINEVRLTGMMHIAEGDFYSDVLPKADPKVPSVVLVEGVTDHLGLLDKSALKYTRVARLLNVTSQDESVFTEHVVTGMHDQKTRKTEGAPKPEKSEKPAPATTGIEFKHADVDVETFHPKTIAFIVTVMSIFQSENLRDVIKTLSDPESPLADTATQTQVMQDILHSRNQRLVSEIQSSLKDYRRVIVPWGALHLEEIESWLRMHDFEQSGEVERKALSFW